MNLYLITGPAGVGKSTISKNLASRLEKSAVIEGESIYNQVVGGYVSAWKSGNHLDLFWKLAILNIKFYLDNAYDVVFNYILDKKVLENITSNISSESIKLAVLLTDEKTLLKRDLERPKDCQMKDRCIALLQSFKNKGFEEKFILDTTNLSISQSVDAILNEDRFILN